MARKKSGVEESSEIIEEPSNIVEETNESTETGRVKFRKSWRDLSPVQKSVNIVMGIVELVLVTLALRDIATRPDSEINGKKRTWVLASLIQPIGPIIYFMFGRKKSIAPVDWEFHPAA